MLTLDRPPSERIGKFLAGGTARSKQEKYEPDFLRHARHEMKRVPPSADDFSALCRTSMIDRLLERRWGGYGRRKKNDYDRAIADYTKAIEINPKFVQAYIARGIFYRFKNHFDRSIIDVNKAIEINPKRAETYNIRGLAYEERNKAGDRDRAIADYRKALELKPSLTESREGLKRLGATP